MYSVVRVSIREYIKVKCLAHIQNVPASPLSRHNRAKHWKQIYTTTNIAQGDNGGKAIPISYDRPDLEQAGVGIGLCECCEPFHVSEELWLRSTSSCK